MSLGYIFESFWATPGAWFAQVLSIVASLGQTPSVTSGVGNTNLTSGTLSINAQQPLYFQDTPLIPTSSKTLIASGNVSPLRFCWIKNLDALNYVSIYSNSSGSSEVIRLLPGDPMLIPMPPSGTLYGQANTASVYLQVYFVAG
jgi:hypothetical protein